MGERSFSFQYPLTLLSSTSCSCLFLLLPLLLLELPIDAPQDPPPQVIADCTAEVSSVLRVLRPSSSSPTSTTSSTTTATDIPRPFTGSTLHSSTGGGGGVFLYLTFGQPHFRKRYLTGEGTTLEVREMGEMFHYYLYVLRKEH